MVAAYNTGRTTRHREAHSSLLDKAADSPIADAPAILERQYPSKVKSAAASERESGVHVGHSLSPSWYTRTTHESGIEKAAAATDWKLTDRPVLAYPSVRDEEAGERVKLAPQKAAQAEHYARCGVMLTELTTQYVRQGELFDTRNRDRSRKLMTALDAINQRHDRDTVFYAASGNRRDWKAYATMKTQHFTTDWRQMLHIRVK
jgi:hypothetical protein